MYRLKQHLNQRRHPDVICKLRNLKEGSISCMLTETPLDRKFRVDQEARKKSSADMVKFLIVNIILFIIYRPQNEIFYMTVFDCILKLTPGQCMRILKEIKNIYIHNNYDLQRMVKLTLSSLN